MVFVAFDLKSEGLVVNKETWLPLVASAGPMVTEHTTAGISKIANSVLIPLADQGISVYPLSTYRTDYVLVSTATYALSIHFAQ
ncbi:GATSL3 [Bugula neritina]|uniref:GATSL3 n=1 Tax=Bugula neritina TaxID=10212 RepID=A0A7J7KKF6_BUGNE|nr:GATSL3 [Bugula neritina]